jgi:hypothetical protein
MTFQIRLNNKYKNKDTLEDILMANLFKTVIPVTGLTISSFFICFVASLILGLVVSCVHMYKSHSSQSFILTLALLPTMVAIVILMVNGNVGTGVAVAGAFSLTRFRSQPGTGREIGSIFFAMMVGLCCGTGYIAIGVVSVVIISVIIVLLLSLGYGKKKSQAKVLSVVIPENLDYSDIFDDLFETYAKEVELTKVKTCNMGSMYKLRYEITLKEPKTEKKLIDEIRTRNGNLEVMIGRPEISEDVI